MQSPAEKEFEKGRYPDMDFSLGLIEIQALGHAILVLDTMTKAADVEFVAVERKLGGRLVTLVIRGKLSAVKAAIDAGRELARGIGCLKAAEVIARPHPEILKFLHLDEKNEKKADSESAATHVGPVASEVKKEEKTADEPKKTAVKKTAKNESSKTAPAVSDKPAPKKRGTKK